MLPSAEQSWSGTIHPLQDLPALLPETDFLIVTLPLTPETKGLILHQRICFTTQPVDRGEM
jgi:phosphoglycerate dehydrogenase-like enzyme